MNKKISFTRVTWYSQIAAIVIFVGVYYLGFYVGSQYEMANGTPILSMASPSQAVSVSPEKLVNNVTFVCATPSGGHAGAYIAAQFLQNADGKASVDLELSDGRTFSLPQAVSADGARYATADGSFVFWNKGNGAFIEENGATTYSGCVTK